jgi:hypothetical protein
MDTLRTNRGGTLIFMQKNAQNKEVTAIKYYNRVKIVVW